MRISLLALTFGVSISYAMTDADFHAKIGYASSNNLSNATIHCANNHLMHFDSKGDSYTVTAMPSAFYLRRSDLINSYCKAKSPWCVASVFSIYAYCNYEYKGDLKNSQEQCIAAMLVTYPNAKAGVELVKKLKRAGIQKAAIYSVLSQSLSEQDDITAFYQYKKASKYIYCHAQNTSQSDLCKSIKGQLLRNSMAINPKLNEQDYAGKYASYLLALTDYLDTRTLRYADATTNYCGLYQALTSSSACQVFNSDSTNIDTVTRLQVCLTCYQMGLGSNNTTNIMTLITSPSDRTTCVSDFTRGESTIGSPTFPVLK